MKIGDKVKILYPESERGSEGVIIGLKQPNGNDYLVRITKAGERFAYRGEELSYSESSIIHLEDADAFLEEEEFSNSALIGWPVEWSDLYIPKPEKDNLHVTCVYIPEVEDEKEYILDVLRDLSFDRSYRIGKVEGVAAFGELENVPVLKVDTDIAWSRALVSTYNVVTRELSAAGIKFEGWEPYEPHVTVDLKTLLNPPKRVILRPLELWYKNDDPVQI